jgi:hypothetical protein
MSDRAGSTDERAPRRRPILRAGVIFVIILLLLYAASLVKLVFDRTVDTAVVSNGTIEKYVPLYTVYIRDEALLVPSASGACIRNIEEGSRVQAGSAVVSIVPGSVSADLARIAEIDRAIIEKSREQTLTGRIYSSDLAMIERDIGETIQKLSIDSMRGVLTRDASITGRLGGLLEKKVLVYADLGAALPEVKALRDERNALTDRIAAEKTEIRVDGTGTVSYFSDGFETVLTPSSIGTLTIDDVDEAIRDSLMSGFPGGTLVAGRPYARIVHGNEYAIAAVLSAGDAPFLAEKGSALIRINDIEKTFEASVERLSDSADGKRLLVLRTDRYLMDTVSSRKASVDLIVSIESGMKIPLRSLVRPDFAAMTAGLYKVDAKVVRYVPLKIVSFNDEYAIVANADESGASPEISVFSRYVTNPGRVAEGQKVP